MSFDELPAIAGSHTQSEESVRALKMVLHLPEFIVREEVAYDYGCDFTIELGVNAQASNFRFQIQLKSEAHGTYVDDARFLSVTMKTSRLHYLLRGTGKSIVVGYDQDTRRLYFEWVENLVSNLDVAGPEWRDQETVRVQLPTENQLTALSARAIHGKVLDFCRKQLERESRPLEYWAPLSSETQDQIKRSDDPSEILALLEAKGVAFASSGYHRETLEVLERVPATRWIQNAPILLTAALAYFHAGLLLQALYYANRTETSSTALGEDEQALLAHIQLSCQLAMGHITLDTYYRLLGRVGEQHPQTAIGLQARLEFIHFQVNQKRRGLDQWERIRQLVEEARREYALATRHLVAIEARWGLELILAEIEFDAATLVAVQGSFQVRLADQLKRPLPFQERLEAAQRSIDLMQAAAKRTIEIHKAAREKGAREVEARALLTVVQSQLKAHDLLSLASPEAQELADTPDGKRFLDELFGYAGRAQQIFETIGLRAMSFKATRAAANILNVQGEFARRDVLIQFLRREAQFLGYHPEKAELETMKRPRWQPKNTDSQESRIADWLSLSAEDLSEYSRILLEALRLPDTRLPHVEKEARARKAIAYEQRHHCRYLELLQNLEHTWSLSTYYASDPLYVGKCEKYAHQSLLEHHEFMAVIASFKTSYCCGCTARTPLQGNRGEPPGGPA